MNYYNDNDPRSAAWLRELICNGLIPPGDVDERSITDVTKSDVAGYTQCHFFAGIGGWPEALRISGWPENRPVWTGSCPCQPFSCAGKRKGEKDSRHLWPEFRRLITECNPPIVFGEQVASKDGRLWLSGVRTDLETLGYAVGASDLCAAGVGAPHIRQRLYWMADRQGERWDRGSGMQRETGGAVIKAGSELGRMENSQSERLQRRCDGREGIEEKSVRFLSTGSSKFSGMADANGRNKIDGDIQRSRKHGQQQENGGVSVGMEHSTGDGRNEWGTETDRRSITSRCGEGGVADANGKQINATNKGGFLSESCSDSKLSFWSRSIWIPCADGKARRIEPESFPLAHGIPGRVGLLRGYGNAIVPEVGAEYIKAYMELIDEILPSITR